MSSRRTYWQGGGLELADMEPTGEPGQYRSNQAMPVGATVDGERSCWKTLLRLHRSMEMMAIPLYLPADAEIDEPEVDNLEGTTPFGSERSFLRRETTPGNGWLSPAVHGTLVAVLALWASAFATAARRLDPTTDRRSNKGAASPVAIHS